MDRRFFYHAFGLGFGGRITRPCCEVLDAQAATALPSVGGYASSRVDGYNFREIISIRSARAYAVGSEEADGTFNTSVTITLEGVNILDAITAESITARLASRHAPGLPEPVKEPVFTAAGTEFRGLRIAGKLVDVEMNCDRLFQESAYTGFRDAEAKGKRSEPWLVSKDGLRMLGSIVTPHAIEVPSVGTVFLGEILVSERARRLTMIRVRMGSPVGGDFEAGSGEVDGSSYP